MAVSFPFKILCITGLLGVIAFATRGTVLSGVIQLLFFVLLLISVLLVYCFLKKEI